jgi:hypothetical protein
MSVTAEVEITGLKEMQARFKAIAQKAPTYLSAAAKESIELHVLNEVGLKRYPPATEANMPGRYSLKTKRPMGYYQRGIGYWYPVMRKTTLIGKTLKNGKVSYSNRAGGSLGARRGAGVAGYKLRRTSERYGTKFMVSRIPYGAALNNAASYAPYLGGRKQSKTMGKYGWRIAYNVAIQNMPKINATFDKWIKKLYKDTGMSA